MKNPIFERLSDAATLYADPFLNHHALQMDETLFFVGDAVMEAYAFLHGKFFPAFRCDDKSQDFATISDDDVFKTDIVAPHSKIYVTPHDAPVIVKDSSILRDARLREALRIIYTHENNDIFDADTFNALMAELKQHTPTIADLEMHYQEGPASANIALEEPLFLLQTASIFTSVLPDSAHIIYMCDAHNNICFDRVDSSVAHSAMAAANENLAIVLAGNDGAETREFFIFLKQVHEHNDPVAGILTIEKEAQWFAQDRNGQTLPAKVAEELHFNPAHNLYPHIQICHVRSDMTTDNADLCITNGQGEVVEIASGIITTAPQSCHISILQQFRLDNELRKIMRSNDLQKPRIAFTHSIGAERNIIALPLKDLQAAFLHDGERLNLPAPVITMLQACNFFLPRKPRVKEARPAL